MVQGLRESGPGDPPGWATGEHSLFQKALHFLKKN